MEERGTARRADWRPPRPFAADDVAYAGDSPETLFYYRPGRILVPADDLRRSLAVLGGAGWAPSDAPVEAGAADVVVLEDRATRQDVPGAVALLREQGVDGAALHVFTGNPKYQGFPLSRPDDDDPPGFGAKGVDGPHVVIVDTGVHPDTPFIAAGHAAWTPADREDLNAFMGDPDEQAGHATFIAGLVKARVPEARVTVIKALDSRGVGDDLSVAAALARVPRDAAVVNLSFGAYGEQDRFPPAARTQLRRIRRETGAVILAAAGNDGLRGRPVWPAGSDDVVAVGAAEPVATGWAACEWSNRGPWLDAYAPGIDLRSAFIRFGTRYVRGGAEGDGTSFATPLVAAAVAGEMRASGADAATALAAVLAVDPQGVDGLPFVAG